MDAEVRTDVVASAAGGDEVAFARIVAAHHDDMVRVAYLVAGDVDIAHEAVQSAWSIAWKKLGTLRDPDRLRPWLVSVAANEARQLLRRARRRTTYELAIDLATEAGTSPHADDDAREASLDLLAALQGLDARDRAIVAMRYALGMTSAEIGKAMRLSPPGVRSRLARSLDRVRKELSDV